MLYYFYVIYTIEQKARVFIAIRHIHPSLIFTCKAGVKKSGAPFSKC